MQNAVNLFSSCKFNFQIMLYIKHSEGLPYKEFNLHRPLIDLDMNIFTEI